MTRTRLGLVALLAGTLVGVPAHAQTGDGSQGAQEAVASLQEAQNQVMSLRQRFDAEVSRFSTVYQAARGVEHETPGFNPKLDPVSPPSRFGDLTYGEMLEYMPGKLIDDVNRRIYREYLRGYHEWEYVALPPLQYMQYEPRDIYGNGVWTSALYTQWDQDVTLIWNIPRSPWGLYIDKRGSVGSGGNIDAQIEALADLRQRAEEQIAHARTFRPDIRERRWLPDVWENKSEWKSAFEAPANGAVRAYREALDRLRRSIDAECRKVTESVVKYDRQQGSDMPVLEFLYLAARRSGTGTGIGYDDIGRSGTGNGYDNGYSTWSPRLRAPRGLTGDALLDWYFDNMFLASLPEDYRDVVEKRFAQAYFRGAYDSKYDNGVQRSSGSGWDYNFGSRYSSGTGDGYSYGSSRRGSVRRTRGAATSTGNGYDSGGTGTGTGGYGTGTGTGSGYNNGSSGTGSGYDNGSSSTGTGGSYQPRPSSNGTGTGTGGGYNSGTGTGTGGGSTYRGSGTGTGSGSGTGTGTGSGY